MLKAKSVLAGVMTAAVLATPYIAFAQSTAGTTTTTTTTKKKRTTTKKAPDRVAEQLDEMRRAIEQQNQQIQGLQQQVQQRDATIQQLQQSVGQAQSTATQAQQAAQAAQQDQQQKLQAVQTDLSDVKTMQTNSMTTLQETQKRIVDMENPTAIHYKGITITPGGFVVGESIWRQRNESADVISTFNGIPFNGSPQSQLTEFRMTARQSRLAVLAEGKLGSTKIGGYWEMDFLGAAPTANENQSSSFNPRQRQLYAQAALSNGWTFTGGQMWSLWSSNKKGIENRQEWIPATIDGQYVVGYDFARLAAFRVTKNFHNKLWIAAALENPEMLNSSSATPVAGLYGFGNGPTGGGVGNTPLANCATTTTTGVITAVGNVFSSCTSTDFMPDILAKVAFEPGWGHYEIKGLMRVFRDKIPGNPYAATPTATYEDKALGGGIGVNAILPIVAKKADLILQANYGEGIGRYSDSTNIDVTLYQDGAIRPLKETQVLAGLELHPTPKLDWYFYGGDEYVGRAWYVGTDTKSYGYGATTVDNSTCQLTYLPTAVAAAKCTGNFRNIQEGTTGFWYRFYKGPAGTVQFGAQFEWIHKNTWPGTNTTIPTAPAAPKANDSMIMTSFRYVLP
jgi:hypothetical protein